MIIPSAAVPWHDSGTLLGALFELKRRGKVPRLDMGFSGEHMTAAGGLPGVIIGRDFDQPNCNPRQALLSRMTFFGTSVTARERCDSINALDQLAGIAVVFWFY